MKFALLFEGFIIGIDELCNQRMSRLRQLRIAVSPQMTSRQEANEAIAIRSLRLSKIALPTS